MMRHRWKLGRWSGAITLLYVMMALVVACYTPNVVRTVEVPIEGTAVEKVVEGEIISEALVDPSKGDIGEEEKEVEIEVASETPVDMNEAVRGEEKESAVVKPTVVPLLTVLPPPLPALSEPPAEDVKSDILQGVTVTMDREDYQLGEVVKVLVRNNLSEPILFLLPAHHGGDSLPGASALIDSKFPDGVWRSLELHPPPPALGVINLGFYRVLNPGESEEMSWDQKIFTYSAGDETRIFVDPGEYRARFVYVVESRARQLGYPDKSVAPTFEDFLTSYSAFQIR